MKPWIGLIRVVNGQRQPGGHPCCTWFPPPMHPASGREDETFAMVLELRGPATSRLYRDIRDAVAQAFWSTSGSPIAALRRAAIAAHRVLLHFNHQVPAESRCRGNLACAALRSDEVFLAMAGEVWARLLARDAEEQHPQQPAPPLGSRAWADVTITYSPIQPGTVLLLSPQNLPEIVALDALDLVLRREEEEILDGLEQLAGGESLTALVVRWPEGEMAPPPPPSRRRRALQPVEAPATPSLVPEEEKVLPEPVSIAEAPLWEMEGEIPTPLPQPWETESPPGIIPSAPSPSPLRHPGSTLIGRLRAIGRGSWRGVTAAGKALVGGVAALGSGLGALASAIGRGGRALFRRLLPGAERRRRTAPRPVRLPPPENPRQMAAVALIILVMVALITLFTWVRYGRDLLKERAISQAQEHIQAAQQAPSPDAARPHWEAVLTLLAEYNDPPSTALRTLAQDTLDGMDGVTRVSPALVADLGSTPGRRLAAWEQSVAVLEDEGQVRRIPMGGESEIIPLPQGASPIDIARYQPESGRTSPTLLILGRGANLWAYDSRWGETRQLPFSPPPGGSDPVAMGTYQGRLYLLDPAVSQIWRYWPRNEQFTSGAEAYFSSEAPSLIGARDLAIDGNIYVLFENGQVARYLDGKAEPFAVTGVPSPAPHFIAMAVDPELTNGPVYLADGATDRIVVLRADGSFCTQLRASGGEFRGLQALTVSDTGNDLFVLAGGKIYRVPIPSLPCR